MIELSNISKKYGKRQILNNVNLHANCGECIAIVGKNGCGKTTLLQIMAGISKPDNGKISYFDKDVLQNRKLFSKYCGYVPQENPLIEELTVKDNLRFWGWNLKDSKETIIENFELKEILNKPVSSLSGGMKRRLSIACSLINQPVIMLLDEPTSALDIYYKESVQTWIQNYRKQNGIVIMTTHDESEIINASRCIVMTEGTLEEITVLPEDRMKKIRDYIINI